MRQAPRLRIQLLGDFCVWVDSREIAENAWRRKAASLVKLLALTPGQRLHHERVLEFLWPELELPPVVGCDYLYPLLG